MKEYKRELYDFIKQEQFKRNRRIELERKAREMEDEIRRFKDGSSPQTLPKRPPVDAKGRKTFRKIEDSCLTQRLMYALPLNNS